MSKSLPPTISVLMPVFNAAQYVKEAIESILNQTFTDFEFLIFNDGSTDSSSEVIRGIKDERIIFFDNQENIGYVEHLNNGLRLAKGKFIARMDADDIALPERFASQVDLLNRESEVVLCGTAYEPFGALNITKVSLPQTDRQIRDFMLCYCPMGHPTVMFRKSAIEQYNLLYDQSYMPAEDYKMWYDLSQIGKLRNLSNVLLYYRVHNQQISVNQNERQHKQTNLIRLLQLTDKGFTLSTSEKELYCKLFDRNMRLSNTDELNTIKFLMQKILYQNHQLQAYSPDVFLEIFKHRWLNFLTDMLQYSPSMLPVVLEKNNLNSGLGLKHKFTFFIKSIVSWKTKKV